MTDPRKELQKKLNKNPLEGIDLQAEHQAIINGKSKLSSLKRKLVLWTIQYNDQQALCNQLAQTFNEEMDKLKELYKTKPQ
jgi:hypothetical protein